MRTGDAKNAGTSPMDCDAHAQTTALNGVGEHGEGHNAQSHSDAHAALHQVVPHCVVVVVVEVVVVVIVVVMVILVEVVVVVEVVVIVVW